MKRTLLSLIMLVALFKIYAQQGNYTVLQNFTDAATPVYTLPVIVHVIHTGTPIGAPDNPPDSSIKAMISLLNSGFRKKQVSFGGADIKIQFKLAAKSPSCGSTTGITRNDGSSIPKYVSGGITNDTFFNASSAFEIAVKNVNRWPNTDYINIWIVNKINGNPNYPGGYTYFPEYNIASIDGLTLNASVVNGSNKTIIHEMGHCLYLYHTFYDGAYETTCAANVNCLTDGDKVCDTEPMKNVDCGKPANTCNSNQPFLIADAAKGYTVLNNYMAYSSCQYMFTAGQRDRMRNALLSFRSGLLSSDAFNTNAITMPAAACAPAAMNGLSIYYGVQLVQFNTLNVYSGTAAADGANYFDRTCNQRTTVTQGMKYTLTVTGSYGNPHRIKVFIDYNNDGDFKDANETLFSVYDDTASKKITIPVSGVMLNTPLRMRVMADEPAKAPIACTLYGGGQAEDYTVIVAPAADVIAQIKNNAKQLLYSKVKRVSLF